MGRGKQNLLKKPYKSVSHNKSGRNYEEEYKRRKALNNWKNPNAWTEKKYEAQKRRRIEQRIKSLERSIS